MKTWRRLLTYTTAEFTIVLNPVHWQWWKLDIYYEDAWGCRKDYPTVKLNCLFFKLNVDIDNGDW